MELLILLLTAHLIGDFYAQPLSWVKCRNTHHHRSISLWKHGAVHTLLNSIVFFVLSVNYVQACFAVVLLSISHLIIDLWKSYRPNHLSYFLIDQTAHVSIILLVWVAISGFTLEQVQNYLTNAVSNKHLIIALAYILVCKPTSVIISLALQKHTDNLDSNHRQSPLSAISEQQTDNTNTLDEDGVDSALSANNHSNTAPTSHLSTSGLTSAGAWIGYLERCLAISFIFMGQFAGVGFLVAIKTIFRFGDLTKNRDMKLTEYMMLGTLLSFSIALFIGWNALTLSKIIN